MTTPEMLGYIRAELAKGRTRQAIHLDLVHGGGWTEADIEEAFKEIPLPAPVIPTATVPQAAPLQPQSQPQAQPISEIQMRYQPTSVQPAAPAMTPPVLQPDSQFVTPLQFIEAQQHQQPVTSPSDIKITPPDTLPIEVRQPATVQSIPEIDHSKERKYFLLGMLFFIVSFLALFVLDVKTVAAKLPSAPGLLLPVILIVLSVTAIIGTYILHRVVRKFKAAQPTWHKAFFAVAIWGIFGSVFLGIEQFMHLSGLSVLVLSLLFFVIQTTVFAEIYAFRPAKAFLAVIINFISLLIVMGIFGVILSIAAASFNNAHQIAVPPVPSPIFGSQ